MLDGALFEDEVELWRVRGEGLGMFWWINEDWGWRGGRSFRWLFTLLMNVEGCEGMSDNRVDIGPEPTDLTGRSLLMGRFNLIDEEIRRWEVKGITTSCFSYHAWCCRASIWLMSLLFMVSLLFCGGREVGAEGGGGARRGISAWLTMTESPSGRWEMVDRELKERIEWLSAADVT